MARHKIGIVGIGKISQDQHIPVIRKNRAFDLVAVASTRGLTVEGVPHAFRNQTEMLEGVPDIDAIAICTPPQVRHAIAREILAAGKHVLLEKPPAATLSELTDLADYARERGLVLFTTWHSQYNEGVEKAREYLAPRTVTSLDIQWKEDVRKWHPGQEWIWDAGSFGVFDPGINGLSVATRIMPSPLFITKAELFFPENRDAPIAANLDFRIGDVTTNCRAEFDWRETGDEKWEMTVGTSDGSILKLTRGGRMLTIDGEVVVDGASEEYEGIYERFDELLNRREAHVDEQPFRLVADAFMSGRRITVEPFTE
ncbi:D-galactose 1-dehydrogenase [Faunimonas pinastri]|uniref:D-galactose 1-dehydrogenase n=1 Tax=Faunimonas pinastri TaxID=1855383 RepID=A0A1H9AQ86_9HYPH|nr:Gfo/Idh/MocA family oxidoreductase [Faunimonas pinastri]SEP78934.1 D-galactose 1-dehydrogenase [Faunimonas pinastri]